MKKKLKIKPKTKSSEWEILSDDLPMYPNGGVAPIVVNDPNDPRLRAYNDSLNLYNYSQSQHKLEPIKDKSLSDVIFSGVIKGASIIGGGLDAIGRGLNSMGIGKDLNTPELVTKRAKKLSQFTKLGLKNELTDEAAIKIYGDNKPLVNGRDKFTNNFRDIQKRREETLKESWKEKDIQNMYKSFDDFKNKQTRLWAEGDKAILNSDQIFWNDPTSLSSDLVHGHINASSDWEGMAQNDNYPKPVQPVVLQHNLQQVTKNPNPSRAIASGTKIYKSLKPLNKTIIKAPEPQKVEIPQIVNNQSTSVKSLLEDYPDSMYYTTTRSPDEKGGGQFDKTGRRYGLVDVYDKKRKTKIKTIDPVLNKVVEMKSGGVIKYNEWEILPEAADGYQWSNSQTPNYSVGSSENINISKTSGNRKLTKKELESNRNVAKAYVENQKAQEYQNRKNKIKESITAQNQPLSLKNIQEQTQATGDKLSFAMNSGEYGDPSKHPVASEWLNLADNLNPAKFVGDVASGIGSVPQDISEGNYLKAGLSVATPLAAGAIAGVGAENTKQFVNNLTNPLAGINVGEYLTTQTPLKNAYKLNPWTFKPNPEAYYRGIGRAGLDDALKSGIIREKPGGGFNETYFSDRFDAAKPYSTEKGYGVGNPFAEDDSWYFVEPKDTRSYIAEIPKKNINAAIPNSTNNASNYWSTTEPIFTKDSKFYREHWLQGYKEIPKPENLTFSTNTNLPKQNNFGSIYSLNPLTLLGENLPEQAYRKIGNSKGLQDIIESGVIRAKNQKGYGTPYFAPNTTWEGYNGVYAVGYQPDVNAGQYLQRASKTNPHRGVVPANEQGIMPSVPFNEQTTLYRRLPFTSAYKTVPKEYLQNPNNHLLTNPYLADLQNLSEKGLKYTGYGVAGHDVYVDEKDRWLPVFKNKVKNLLSQKKSGGKIKSSDWEIIE